MTKAGISIVGIVLIGLAFLANSLGIDNNTEWGAGRKLSLILGGSILLVVSYGRISEIFGTAKVTIAGLASRSLRALGEVTLAQLVDRSDPLYPGSLVREGAIESWRIRYRQSIENARTRLNNSRAARLITQSNERMAILASWSLFVTISLIYVWIVSVGRWNDWPDTTDFYSQLAEAFKHGQVELLTKPKPELLRLSDPYEHDLRAGIFFPWDVSLYNGNFYLYWGPAPGVILALVESLVRTEVGDQYLVFAFSLGALGFGVLLLMSLWRRHFNDLSWWTVCPGILVIGLANPMPWLLNRPAIYEAAAAGGQFFLIAGLYWAYTGHENRRMIPWRLALAGVCWALAVATRSTLTPAVAFLTVTVLVRIGKLSCRGRFLEFDWRAIGSFSVPLIVGAISLGWYNHARFGSFLESGHRYQLTGMNLNRLYDIVISGANILPNLYNYLLNPLRTLSVFPFVKPHWGGQYIWPFYMPTPEHYYTEQVTGTLYAAPFVWFSFIPVWLLAAEAWSRFRAHKKANYSSLNVRDDVSFRWLITSVLGATVLLFIPLLLFVVASMRYLADVIPTWVILSTIGFWLGYRHTAMSGKLRRGFVALTFILVLISITIGFLLAITGYQARFEKLNPQLFEQITRFAAW